MPTSPGKTKLLTADIFLILIFPLPFAFAFLHFHAGLTFSFLISCLPEESSFLFSYIRTII